nr:MAG: flagellar motor switch protein FliG [bacterium]
MADTLKPENLTGPQKVAVFLMAVGPEKAAELTKGFSPEELEAVTLEIARLDSVPRSVTEAVLAEWRELEKAAGSLAAGGVEYARQILERALGPQKAMTVLRRIQNQLNDGRGFRTLRQADPDQLSTVLRNEHPQLIALILAHLPPEHTAAVLNRLPATLGADVLFRIARMEKVLPDVLQAIEQALGTEAMLSLSTDMSLAGGPAAVAAVLNLVPATIERDLLEGLSARDPALADEIKDLMFTFDDLAKLDDRSLQRVLRDVEVKELALALKAASEEVKNKILGTMSQRAVAALKEEMEFLGAVRLRDVEAAQGAIVKVVRALEEAGEIVINGGSDDLVIE